MSRERAGAHENAGSAGDGSPGPLRAGLGPGRPGPAVALGNALVRGQRRFFKALCCCKFGVLLAIPTLGRSLRFTGEAPTAALLERSPRPRCSELPALSF